MLGDPTKMVFENSTDIVDYVSKGMVPTRRNFEKVMYAVRYPTPEGADPEVNHVRIPDHVFFNCDKDTIEEVVSRMYHNRVRNRNIGLGIAGVVAAGIIIGKISSSRDKDDVVNDDMTSIGMDIDLNSINL